MALFTGQPTRLKEYHVAELPGLVTGALGSCLASPSLTSHRPLVDVGLQVDEFRVVTESVVCEEQNRITDRWRAKTSCHVAYRQT